jgi:DivIVA domain-containing protein
MSTHNGRFGEFLEYSRSMFRSASPPGNFRAAVVILWLGSLVAGCTPDPRSVEGALAAAVQAIGATDGRKLYRLIDERARHAMISIVRDRQRAAELVRKHYPEPARSQTLAELGDAALATDAADLFTRRCDASMFDIGRAGGTMPLEPEDIQSQRFRATLRGYDVEAVNHFLAQVARDYQLVLDAATEWTASARDEPFIDSGGNLSAVKERANFLLAGARRDADKTKEEARAEARQIREQAAMEAAAIKAVLIRNFKKEIAVALD